MKKLLITLFFLFILYLVNVNAAMSPAPPFCEHQGYILEDNYCVFDDGNKCKMWEFFRRECGSEYVKEFPCRKLGEIVFPQFEECCEGKPYNPPKFLAQPSCQSFRERLIGNLKYHPFYNYKIIIGILLILIVGIIIKAKRKR